MNNKLYKLMNWPGIEEIVYSESNRPHEILGPHNAGGGTLLQTFQPGAKKVEVVLNGLKKTAGEKTGYKMEMADENGYFVGLLPGHVVAGNESGRDSENNNTGVKNKAAGKAARDQKLNMTPDGGDNGGGSRQKYVYRVTGADGEVTEIKDAYAFLPQLDERELNKFTLGINYTVYEKLGAHPLTIRGTKGVSFAIWAPNAIRVSVVGDFNRWDGRVHQMSRRGDSGIFEIFVPDVSEGALYKFELKIKDGLTYLKADPYAFGQQLRPETASVVRDLRKFAWEDSEWLAIRKARQSMEAPISVYELYLGSFRRRSADNGYLNYRELAPLVVEYVKEMKYTHIELMPVMEHPRDESWGYHVIGYYAPTARFGTAADLMYFINEMHRANIGVIMDWVPSHFPRDDYGLSNFDGTCLYEHFEPRKNTHPHSGTLLYNYGRPQVSNYLIANALYWVEKYHIDGLRIDAVDSMLYLDYGKPEGGWVANMYGGNENLEALEFIKHLNSMMKRRNPGVLMIAEESTSWPQITGGLDKNGLGFDLKWNVGWTDDYLRYIVYDPYFRAHHHHELTFSMIYAYSDNFMLAFTHEEAGPGQTGMIAKMPGEIKDQFANLRLTYAYQMTHPGKKMLFMGQDWGVPEGFNIGREVDWSLLANDRHYKLNRMVRELNQIYRGNPALFTLDNHPDGFRWINCIAAEQCMISFIRYSKKIEEMLVIVVNFANITQEFTVGVPEEGRYEEIFNSDAKEFGGGGRLNLKELITEEVEADESPYSFTMSSAPLSLSIFSYIPFSGTELAERNKIKAAKINEQLQKEKAAVEKRKAAEKAAAEERAKAEKIAAEERAKAAKIAAGERAKAEKAAAEAAKIAAGERAEAAKAAAEAAKIAAGERAEAEKAAAEAAKIAAGERAEAAKAAAEAAKIAAGEWAEAEKKAAEERAKAEKIAAEERKIKDKKAAEERAAADKAAAEKKAQEELAEAERKAAAELSKLKSVK